MENKKKVMARVGDVIRVVDSAFLVDTGGLEYVTVTEVGQGKWYYITGRGKRDYWANPLSDYFELAKNTIVINILNDL